MNLTLTVSHNIFLSHENRYAINDGKEIEVVGVSTPVWVYKKTSEPANEIFCRYKITPTDYQLHIKHNAKGYDLLLPKSSHNPVTKVNNPVMLKNILDFKDGGIEWIAFRQFHQVRKNNKDITIAHFIEIKDMGELIQTLS